MMFPVVRETENAELVEVLEVWKGAIVAMDPTVS